MRAEETDAELLEHVRAGRTEAFAALWNRHVGAALSVARSFAGLDPEDIVSESYERILVSLRQGKGPRGAFRPYLIATVRNTGRQHYNRRAARREDGLSDDSIVDPGADSERAAIAADEYRTATIAFESLPERWQEALWYSQVDDLPPREIAQRLGIRANAVSALVLRAKRGFRDAWLSSQLAGTEDPECREVISQLGTYTRDGLGPRARSKVDAHLAVCQRCPAALAEARTIARDLSLVILPAVAGTVGAAQYVSTMSAPAQPVALASPAGSSGPVASSTAEPGVPVFRRALLISALVMALTGAGIGATWLAALPRPEYAVSADAPFAAPLPSRSDASSSVGATTPPVGPAPEPTVTVAPLPSGSPSTAEALSPPAMPEPSAAPSATPSASASWPVAAPPTAPAPPDVPDAAVRQVDPRMYPWMTGSQAEPGAVISIRDAEGRELATTTADAFGDWLVHVVVGHAGTSTVSVTQTISGKTSPPTTEFTFSVAPPPVPVTPLPHAVVDGRRTHFQAAESAGTVLQRRLAAAGPIQTLVIPANETWNEYLVIPTGSQVLRLRYADARGAEFGPWSETVLDVR